MTIKKTTEGTGISKRDRVSISMDNIGKEEISTLKAMLQYRNFEERISGSEQWAHSILKELWPKEQKKVESLPIPIPDDHPYLALLHLGGYAHDSREGYARRIITKIDFLRDAIDEKNIELVAIYSLELGAMIQQCADKYRPEKAESAKQPRTSALNQLIVDLMIDAPSSSAKEIANKIESLFKNKNDRTNFIISIDEEGSCKWHDRKKTTETLLYDSNFSSRVSKLK